MHIYIGAHRPTIGGLEGRDILSMFPPVTGTVICESHQKGYNNPSTPQEIRSYFDGYRYLITQPKYGYTGTSGGDTHNYTKHYTEGGEGYTYRWEAEVGNGGFDDGGRSRSKISYCIDYFRDY
jgi:hypothetical protein